MMNDMTERENQMLRDAGALGGEYLDSLNKYDLRYLSRDEWTQFLRSCIGKFAELKMIADKSDELDDEIPF